MPHQWLKIAVGRVCVNCSVAQADGEFDDGDGACPNNEAYKRPERRQPPGGEKPGKLARADGRPA